MSSCLAGPQDNGAESGRRGVEGSGLALCCFVSEQESERLQARMGLPPSQLGHPCQEVSGPAQSLIMVYK